MAAGANGKVTAKPGVCTVNFNAGNAANTCGATYSAGGAPLASSHFRTGNAPGQYAAPAGDSTVYLTVGPTDGSPITITLGTAANYFGFYAGSLDLFNMVQFFLGGVLIDSFTGTQINAVAFPGTAANGSNAEYIDYFPTGLYDRIVYSSSSNAFETDNHAFGIATPGRLPEPSPVLLMGLGAIALLLRRRRTACDGSALLAQGPYPAGSDPAAAPDSHRAELPPCAQCQ